MQSKPAPAQEKTQRKCRQQSIQAKRHSTHKRNVNKSTIKREFFPLQKNGFYFKRATIAVGGTEIVVLANMVFAHQNAFRKTSGISITLSIGRTRGRTDKGTMRKGFQFNCFSYQEKPFFKQCSFSAHSTQIFWLE